MKGSTNMLQGPLYRGIIGYTIPIILSSVLQLLFNAADLVVVGQFCGSVSVGAVSATGSITNLIVNLFVGLSVGAGVCVAHGLGSRSSQQVHRTIHTAIPVALASGVLLTAIGVPLAKPLLEMMDTPRDVLPLSVMYMRIYFSGITFTVLYNFASSILRAAGDTKSPLLYLTIAGVLNVALNLVFVTVFHMNVAGVALATIISQGVSAGLVIRALMRRQDDCHLQLNRLKIHKEQLVKMVRIGLPAGVQGSLFSISNVIIQSSINSFDSAALVAGNGAATNIEGFVYTALNAFSQTAVNYVGQNAGAMQYQRIRKICRACLVCVGITGLTLGPLTFLAGPSLLSFYITDSAEAIAWGVTRMSYICLFYCLCGLMDVTTGALRGLGSSFVPMVVTVMGVCVLRILWVYTVFQIPQYHTPNCLYLSYLVSWTLTFLVQLPMLGYILRKRERQAAQLA